MIAVTLMSSDMGKLYAALAQAVMVYQMRERGMSPPVPVNEANIDFVDEHWEEIQQLAASAVGQARPRS